MSLYTVGGAWSRRMERVRVDSVFSWVVALCASLLNVITCGIKHNYSILAVALLDEYGEEESITTLAGGLAASDFLGRFPRQLTLLQGITYTIIWYPRFRHETSGSRKHPGLLVNKDQVSLYWTGYWGIQIIPLKGTFTLNTCVPGLFRYLQH